MSTNERAAYAGPTNRDTFGIPSRLVAYSARVEQRIAELLDAELHRWRMIDEDLHTPLEALRALVTSGGKRFRPAFCFAAFVGAGGEDHDAHIINAGAALELLHTSALVHDDIMDASDFRRGALTVHRQFIDGHRAGRHRGESRRFGEGAAILLGDFALVYSDMLISAISAPARAIYDELRIELLVGQYLDLVGTAGEPMANGTRHARAKPVIDLSRGAPDLARAQRIALYKSAKYTVERPLHLGAALAGDNHAHDHDLTTALSTIGLPLGEAFQLRDDLLGVFGDSAVTGKPVGDDLREGKLTPLLAIATGRLVGTDTPILGRLGAPDLSIAEISELQELFVSSGAAGCVESTICDLVETALVAIDAAPIADEARNLLRDLASFAAWRDR